MSVAVKNSFLDFKDAVPLGRGKFGVVYRCDDSPKTVVKVIKFEKEIRGIIIREINIHRELSRLKPNFFVPLHGVEFDDCDGVNRTVKLTMEYCGFSLKQMLEGGIYGDSIALFKDAAVQLSHAVAFMHSRGFLHRDISPGNILHLNGVWRLADFGLCCTNLTKPRGRAGTPKFRAPELEKKPSPGPTTSSDVYSLAVCLKQMVCNYKLRDMDPRWSVLLSEMMRLSPNERPSMYECMKRIYEIRRSEAGFSMTSPEYDLSTFLVPPREIVSRTEFCSSGIPISYDFVYKEWRVERSTIKFTKLMSLKCSNPTSHETLIAAFIVAVRFLHPHRHISQDIISPHISGDVDLASSKKIEESLSKSSELISILRACGLP